MKTSGIQLIAEFIDCPPNLLNDENQLSLALTEGINKCGMHQVSLLSHKFDPIGVTVISIINESHIAIHTYPEAHHASIDIFHCSSESRSLFELLEHLKHKLRPQTVKFIEISRGDKLELSENNAITSCSRYGFEVRYHFENKLFEKKSKFHKIEIIENDNFGRMMFLDGDLQLAEKDVDIYNKIMVAPLLISDKIGSVAILGGGDGGVLNELLKHDPQKVFLIDIDEDVILLSKKYFQKVCGSAFDHPNVDIIIGDANQFLDTHGDIDAIIYDLTADPELLTRKDKCEFLSEIYARIYKSLKPGGIISLQCCSEFDAGTLNIIKELLSVYFTKIRFKTVFIPSFCEPWVFGSAKRK
jgi:S-adenosylmethionine decarboxylase proenzyme